MEEEVELNQFMGNVWSPYCKGISLLECPSGQAEDLRKQVRQLHQEGASIDEIQGALRAEYGNEIRMTPPDQGRGNLAYSLPWIAFILVCIFVAIYWSRRGRKPKEKKLQQDVSTEERQKIESEIEMRF